MDSDPAPDPAIFDNDLQKGNQINFFCLLLLEATFTSFFTSEVTLPTSNSEGTVKKVKEHLRIGNRNDSTVVSLAYHS